MFNAATTRSTRWVARIVVLATLLVGTGGYVSLHKTLHVEVDGYTRSVNVMARTVKDALRSADISIADGDIIFPAVDASLDDGDYITIRTSKNIEVEIDGSRQVVKTTAVTVGDMLEELGTRAHGAEVSASRSEPVGRDIVKISTLKEVTVEIDGGNMTTTTLATTVRDVLLELDVVLNEGDTVSLDLDDQLTDGDKIVVSRAGASSDTITESLPFKTVEKKDPNLIKGEKVVLQKGRAGKAVTTYDIATLDGQESERKVLARTVLSEPQDEVIGIGTLDVSNPATSVLSPNEARALAKSMVASQGWEEGEYACLNKLWTKESNWRVTAQNASSGAYGIPQSLPGSKMGSVASDWRTNAKTQITWGLNYIKGRYGTPCNAWGHSQRKGWY